jgi:hypothetical protein
MREKIAARYSARDQRRQLSAPRLGQRRESDATIRRGGKTIHTIISILHRFFPLFKGRIALPTPDTAARQAVRLYEYTCAKLRLHADILCIFVDARRPSASMTNTIVT